MSCAIPIIALLPDRLLTHSPNRTNSRSVGGPENAEGQVNRSAANCQDVEADSQ